jgi:hypothetical protein
MFSKNSSGIGTGKLFLFTGKRIHGTGKDQETAIPWFFLEGRSLLMRNTSHPKHFIAKLSGFVKVARDADAAHSCRPASFRFPLSEAQPGRALRANGDANCGGGS